jgi:hypothetical protein
MLQLESVLEENSADGPPGGTEKPHSWKATNKTTNPLGGCDRGFVAGQLPLHDGGEWRELARLNETKQLLTRHIGVRPARHRGDRVLSGLEAQEVAAPWMWKSMGSKMRARRKKIMGKQSPEPVPGTRF